MKTTFVCLLCFSSAMAIAADDPYEAALTTLPQEHSRVYSNVAPINLDEAEQIALQSNPEIRVAARKVAMAEAHVSGDGALDDPSVMYREWQVPLTKPWDYNAESFRPSFSASVTNSKSFWRGGRAGDRMGNKNRRSC